MRIKLQIVFIYFFALLISSGVSAQAQFKLRHGLTADDLVAGKIIFKVKPGLANRCMANGVQIESLNDALAKINSVNTYKKYPNHTSPGSAKNSFGYSLIDLSVIYETEYDQSIPVEKAINMLLSTGTLEYAEPVYKIELLYNPNDPDTASQYYLGLIKAYEAWDITLGDSNFVVGVTDTGTDLDHPDLAGGIKYNYNDPVNGIDDDADGYTDNFQGWDVGEGDNDPSVDLVHGSFVSGFAGAVTDNGVGIAGPGFKTRFLPVKISNNGILNAAYEGIVYAADHGCQVINCSWGGFGGGQYGQDIVDYATINKNALVIGASGNSNNEAPFYPASFDNVLSVTGTNNTDTKWVNSSYGAFVDISAPGEAVYSTIFDNTYSFSSGTSFAAPIVAAAAALLRTQFAFYTPMQIAEQLRATSDDIYTVPGNSAYINKLGKGRLNMLRALTESPKSVRMIQNSITDNNDNAFAGNDTLEIITFLRNYLDPLSNLTVTLTCNSPDITILNGTINPGAMGTLSDYDNTSNPFVVTIGPAVPFNTKATFTLNFTDGTYSDWQIFDLVVNVDYINVLVNDVGTSITSRGRIGYNESSQVQGIGFTYNNGSSLLYESGFVIGIDTVKVSDHIFGTPSTVLEDDFVSMINVRKIIPTVHSDFDLDSRFNDDGAGVDKLDVEINQKTYAWSTPADSKYILVEYIISNQGASALNNLYAGIFADWDIGAVVDNRGEHDPALKMGYAFNTGSPTYYAGVKQITGGGHNMYALDNDGSGGSIGVYNGYTELEKYLTMSTPRPASGQSGAGGDVSLMVASGPHSIAAGDSVTVAFALLAGETLASIQASAQAAEIKYSTINSIPIAPDVPLTGMQQNFPNPFSESTVINYSIANQEKVKIELFDVTGRSMRVLVDDIIEQGYYSVELLPDGLNDGIYICRFNAGETEQTVRLTLLR